MITRFTLAMCLLLGFLCLPRMLQAQMFTYDDRRPVVVQSLSVGYHVVDFLFDGEGNPESNFNFNSPVYSVYFTRPAFQVSFAYGREPSAASDLPRNKLLDAMLFFWGEVPLGRTSRGYLFLPIVLHSGYRGVGENPGLYTSGDAFSLATMGIGSGLGFKVSAGERLGIEGRATPIFALASRGFEGQAGSSTIFDADLQAHMRRLFGRIGFSVGYGFRTQRWNASSSTLIVQAPDDLFHYRGIQHSVRAGFNW